MDTLRGESSGTTGGGGRREDDGLDDELETEDAGSVDGRTGAASPSDTPTALTTVESLRQSANMIDDHVQRLIIMLRMVNQSLTGRTSQAAIMTNSHVATTRQLSHVATIATSQLDQLSRTFLQNIAQLRQHFRTIKALAQATAQVRAQVLRLEAQVARL